MPASHEPRFKTYGVVNAHTDEVVSVHRSRAKAEAAKNADGGHALRVRGLTPVDAR